MNYEGSMFPEDRIFITKIVIDEIESEVAEVSIMEKYRTTPRSDQRKMMKRCIFIFWGNCQHLPSNCSTLMAFSIR